MCHNPSVYVFVSLEVEVCANTKRGKESETEKNSTEEENSVCKRVGDRQRRRHGERLYMVILCSQYMAPTHSCDSICQLRQSYKRLSNVYAVCSLYIPRLQLQG